ncbi:DegT/DnrJ/EryC1/StrS family aminotransferase [Paenibacillus hemerocallicola]|jgi:dTDP-4-amino-4,6-dideoxygalactose transaminase|uniref:DegT/DnrJ/EryC1/StrS family aminotransferase n=1 Tax=Paenibacillus hemerocallicola TaxID=1172614 RepID=A0A5C4T5K3_9BACL|nr:DegT/DnrJ/EryC1/StrS family aminotransferase [Paenibacillus hemerocallicola]TNJ64364.1 DegT/DnrJ/EryC1/StrS family aminotransferase [Paenibacillus hemerocallicola]
MLAFFGGKPEVTVTQPHSNWPIVLPEVIRAVQKYLEDGSPLSISDKTGVVNDLETSFEEYYGLPYALLTNSGSNALFSAFMAIGIGPGDEVIAPTYAFHACITSVINRGAVPVLCDTEPDSMNIDAASIEQLITPRTRAIVVVHNWGHPVDLERIRLVADRHGLYLIEDCSHAHGSEYNHQKVGTFGDISCFSLQANKLVCAGEGGVLLTPHRELYERACLLGHYRGRSHTTIKSKFYKQFAETGYGLKNRIHPLAAVIAREYFLALDDEVGRRVEMFHSLNEILRTLPGINPPLIKEYVTRHSYYGYKPEYNPDELEGLSMELFIDALKSEGVEIHKPTFKMIHQLELYRTRNNRLYPNTPENWRVYGDGDFPNSEKLITKLLTLSIPTGPESKSIMEQYMNAFYKVVENYRKLLDYSTVALK